MALDVPPLPAGAPIVDPKSGLPSLDFTVYWQQVIGGIVDAINAVAAAQAAADAANAAAAAADTAATNAQTAADEVTSAQELGSSYVSGATITATDVGSDVTITISAHTRHYPQPDGTTVDVAVNGGSVTGRAYATKYWLYYDQASRAGGAVSYLSTTTETTAAQIGDRHVVGSVLTPVALAGPTGGGVVRPPGSGSIP